MLNQFRAERVQISRIKNELRQNKNFQNASQNVNLKFIHPTYRQCGGMFKEMSPEAWS